MKKMLVMCFAAALTLVPVSFAQDKMADKDGKMDKMSDSKDKKAKKKDGKMDKMEKKDDKKMDKMDKM